MLVDLTYSKSGSPGSCRRTSKGRGDPTANWLVLSKLKSITPSFNISLRNSPTKEVFTSTLANKHSLRCLISLARAANTQRYSPHCLQLQKYIRTSHISPAEQSQAHILWSPHEDKVFADCKVDAFLKDCGSRPWPFFPQICTWCPVHYPLYICLPGYKTKPFFVGDLSAFYVCRDIFQCLDQFSYGAYLIPP